MEALCATCPLRNTRRDYAPVVEICQARPEDAEDRAAVLALAQGEVLLTALAQPRPDRCQMLDNHLPDKRYRHAHRRPDHIVFSSCAEMALSQAIAPNDFPDDIDIDPS